MKPDIGRLAMQKVRDGKNKTQYDRVCFPNSKHDDTGFRMYDSTLGSFWQHHAGAFAFLKLIISVKVHCPRYAFIFTSPGILYPAAEKFRIGF
jgi:hypothetical protein